MNTTGSINAKDHPFNANLPNINRPETILGVTITFLTLAVIAISLRLWVRLRDSLWGWDDAFVLLAGLASIIGDCIVCLMPADGLGLHLWTLNYTQIEAYFRHVYASNVCYCASATFIKLAILFQYLRLFAETASSTASSQYRMARRITITLIIVSSIWGLAFFLLAVFPCYPIAKDWNIALEGKCMGWGSKEPETFFAMFAGHSASNMLLDILVLATPLPFLSMLRLAGKSRVGLITLFGLGCTVCAVSIGRMISLAVNRAGTVPVLDMTYYTTLVYLFSVLEVNIAIIAASIPIFWPVIATMATNKIWVVNEIEVRVENQSRGSVSTGGDIDLTEQSSWGTLDKKEDFGGRTSGLSVITKVYDRVDPHSHGRKASNASSVGRNVVADSAGRFSHESQRKLCRIPSVEVGGRKGSVSKSDREDWFAEGDKQYTGGTVTKIESTEMPFEQIRKLDR